MKKRALITLIFLMVWPAWGGGGQDVGNGGDLLICSASDKNPFNGLYTLDYVASYDPLREQIVNDPSPLETIWNSLHQKGKASNIREFDRLSRSLLLFLQSANSQVFKSSNPLDSMQWIPQTFGLIDVQDEQLIQQIPANCHRPTEKGGGLNLIQAIIRQENGLGRAIFRYDPTALKKLYAQSKFQFSQLMIHEWMRDVVKDTWRLRDIVGLVHSKLFLEADPVASMKMFRNAVGPQLDFIPHFSAEIPRHPETIVIPENLEELQERTFESLLGTSVIYQVAYSEIFQRQCLIVPTGWNPYPVVGSCPREVVLEAGQDFWISGTVGEPPLRQIKAFKVLSLQRSQNPVFDFHPQ